MAKIIPLNNPIADPKRAFAEAQRRIESWQPGEQLDLRIQHLERIPDELADLSELQDLMIGGFIYRWGSPLSNLSLLSGLAALTKLSLAGNQVKDLSHIAGLTRLTSLGFSHTQVKNLSHIAGLTRLTSLSFSDTQVEDLSHIAGLEQLTHLEFSSTQVEDLSHIAGLEQLTHLDFNDTQVDDLGQVAGLKKLKSLFFSKTQVKNLAPLVQLSELRYVLANHLKLKSLKPIQATKFNYLTLPGQVPGYPDEVLGEFCQDRFYAHVADMKDGDVELRDAKLMILGNGRVGKTKIRRPLLGETKWTGPEDSTHGVHIEAIENAYIQEGKLTLWDFGGQDMYHGTHKIFLKSRCVFMICWNPEFEKREQTEACQYGYVHENYPLSYWLDYVYQVAGPDAPIILVKTQCDTQDGPELTQQARASFERFNNRHECYYCAFNDRNRISLDANIAAAHNQLNKPLIGYGRLEAKQRLDALAAEQVLKRLSKSDEHQPLMSKADFHHICNEVRQGGKLISDEAMLLRFLHDAGTVFHLSDRDQDHDSQSIVLDQQWILNVLYRLLDRKQGIVADIRENQGRFRRKDLKWDPDYSRQEQDQFLTMMCDTGLAFEEVEARDGREAKYVAPEMLPDALDWDAWGGEPEQSHSVAFDFLSPSLIRSIIAHFGTLAAYKGRYWRDGVMISDEKTRARGRVYQKRDTVDWQGSIIVETQSVHNDGGGDCKALLTAMLEELAQIDEAFRRDEDRPTAPPVEDAPDGNSADESAEAASGSAIVPAETPSAYFSYAWKDDKDQSREDKVNELDERAKALNFEIKRDKREVRNGQSIRDYTDQLGAGSHIYVFLSDKYIRSDFCVYELAKIWDASGRDLEKLKDRLSVVVLDDADIFGIDGLSDHIIYWKERSEELNLKAKEMGLAMQGRLRDYMTELAKFSYDIGTILEHYADVKQMSWEEFLTDFEQRVQASQP